ncbi:unnamed protein product [Alopecurus aequalis]
MEPPAPASSRPPALPMEPPALDPEAATLRSRRQKLQAMEVLDFHGVDFVRLRLLRCGRRAYLHAAEDGRSLRLDPRRESHNAVWAVTPHFYGGMAIDCVLLRGAYGRYLGAPDPTPRGIRLCPFSPPPPPLPRRQAARLRQRGGPGQLVARRRHQPPGRLPAARRERALPPRQLEVPPAVLLRTPRLRLRRPPLHGDQVGGGARPQGRQGAGPPETDCFALRPRLPCLCFCTSEREIRWVSPQPNEANWTSARYTGRLTLHLKGQLVNQVPRKAYIPDYTLCVRADRYGQLSPLVVNLPRSREPLYIVVLERNTADCMPTFI